MYIIIQTPSRDYKDVFHKIGMVIFFSLTVYRDYKDVFHKIGMAFFLSDSIQGLKRPLSYNRNGLFLLSNSVQGLTIKAYLVKPDWLFSILQYKDREKFHHLKPNHPWHSACVCSSGYSVCHPPTWGLQPLCIATWNSVYPYLNCKSIVSRQQL